MTEKTNSTAINTRQAHEDSELIARGLSEKGYRIVKAFWKAKKALTTSGSNENVNGALVQTATDETQAFNDSDGTSKKLVLESVTENPDRPNQHVRSANLTLWQAEPGSATWDRMATVYTTDESARIELDEYGQRLFPDMLDSDVAPIINRALDVAETQLHKRRNGVPGV